MNSTLGPVSDVLTLCKLTAVCHPVLHSLGRDHKKFSLCNEILLLYFNFGNRYRLHFEFCLTVIIFCFPEDTCGSGQVPRNRTGRNKTLPPYTNLPVIGEIAGVSTASLGGYLYSSKKRARWVEGFHDELNGHVFDLERDGLRQVVLCP